MLRNGKSNQIKKLVEDVDRISLLLKAQCNESFKKCNQLGKDVHFVPRETFGQLPTFTKQQQKEWKDG